MKDLIEYMKECFPYTNTQIKFGILPHRNNEIMDSFSDTSSLSALGWHPKFDYKKGIKLWLA